MKVLKFGGKSLSTPEKVQNICRNIQKIYKKDKNLIIVVSAFGKTTNELFEKAQIFGGEKINTRELDVLLSVGETSAAALVAIMLNSMGVPAKSFQGFQIELTTFGDYQNSKIAHLNKQLILECFKKEQVVVIAGFQGINKNGDITTLGRGGSDTTAAALGAVFDIPVEIYSDYNGVFAGDPKLLNFKKLKKLNFNTMQSMAKAGAKVLDFRATEIAKKFNTNIISKSSTEMHKTGTLISNIEDNVVAISSIDALSKITITFSDKSKIKFIVKNVLSCQNNVNFYNFTINFNEISFYVESSQKLNVIKFLSKKLNLLN